VKRADGESWECEDGCNICNCRRGKVLQTLELCDVDGCIDHNEVKRADGESWECEDGCNICTCLRGQVLQTLEACDVSPNICGAGTKNCGTGCVARSTQCNETCDERSHCKLDVVTGRNIENWYNLCVETYLIDGTSDFKECNGFCIPKDENCDCTWGFCRGEDGYCVDTFRNQGVKTCDGDYACVPQPSKCGGKCTEDECENEDGTCSRVVAEANTPFSPFTLLNGRCDGRCQPLIGAEPCHGKCEIRFGDVDQGPGTVFEGKLDSAGRCVYSDLHPIVFLD